MRIKINALDLYMIDPENQKLLTSQDLNKRDNVLFNIQFLEENLGKEIFIHSENEEYVEISLYEKSKKYVFPKYIVESNEEKEEEEEEKKEFKNFNFDFKILIIFILLISLIMLIISKVSFGDELNPDEVKIRSEFDILSDVMSQNMKIIGEELEEQKKYRNKVNESIERVKKLEEENELIRKDMISKAQ